MMMLHQAKEAPQSSSEGASEAEDGRGSQSSLSISKPIEELKMKIKETRDKRLIQTLQGIDLYAAEKMFSPVPTGLPWSDTPTSEPMGTLSFARPLILVLL